LTYNWDFLGKPLKDGTPAPADASSLWELWKAWKAEKKEELNVFRSTSTLEQSLESTLEGRLHLHWKVELRKAIDHTTLDSFLFHGVRPDARSPWQEEGGKTARGASYAQSNNRTHFYVWAPKFGTLFVCANWKPFRDYRVNGKWL